MKNIIKRYKLFKDLQNNEKYKDLNLFSKKIYFIEKLILILPFFCAIFPTAFCVIHFVDNHLFLQIISSLLFFTVYMSIFYIFLLGCFYIIFKNNFKKYTKKLIKKETSKHCLKEHLELNDIRNYDISQKYIKDYNSEIINILKLKNLTKTNFLKAEIKSYNSDELLNNYKLLFEIFNKKEYLKKDKDKFYNILFNRFKELYENNDINHDEFYNINDYLIINIYSNLDHIVEKRSKSRDYFGLINNVYKTKNNKKEIDNIKF